MMYQMTYQIMQIHEGEIHQYIQYLQKTNFKHIQRKNRREIRDNKYKAHHTKY